MHDPVAIEPGTAQDAWCVVVPDLPGCFSAGDPIEDARLQAEQAVTVGIEATRDAGESRSGFTARMAIEGRSSAVQA